MKISNKLSIAAIVISALTLCLSVWVSFGYEKEQAIANTKLLHLDEKVREIENDLRVKTQQAELASLTSKIAADLEPSVKVKYYDSERRPKDKRIIIGITIENIGKHHVHGSAPKLRISTEQFLNGKSEYEISDDLWTFYYFNTDYLEPGRAYTGSITIHYEDGFPSGDIYFTLEYSFETDKNISRIYSSYFSNTPGGKDELNAFIKQDSYQMGVITKVNNEG